VVKTLLRAAVLLLLSLQALGVQARTYNQGELDAILAPVALYPDPLLTHVLNAAAFPDDVAAAAQWRRDNPNHNADQALRDVEGYAWHPSVKALVAQPELLQRLAESPQWLADLGEAFLNQPQEVHATVQQLRMRAQQNGSLRSDENQYVYQQGPTIVVQPAWPNVVYAPYYNPYVVYGGWWWPAYRPVFFRPFVPCAVRVAHYYPVVPLRPWPLARPWSGRTWTAPPTAQPQPSQFRSASPWRGTNAQPQLNQARPQAQAARMMPPPAMQATPYRALPESRRAPVVQSYSNVRGGYVGTSSFRAPAFSAGSRGASAGSRGGGGGRVRS
jgi:hypothetical protein